MGDHDNARSTGDDSPSRVHDSPSTARDEPIPMAHEPMVDDAAARVFLVGVTKRYGSTTALEDVIFTTEPGTIHGLVGPNGSGKTTMLRLIAGLANPTTGRISRPAGVTGYSFQEPRFFPDLTVRENLSVFRSLADDPEPVSWVETLLSALRLEPVETRRARDLSGGFRKKLDLALALLDRPQLLLLDEPLADVDRFSRRKIRSFLTSYATDDRTILISSHNGDEFADAYDRLTVLVDGTVRADGAPDDEQVAAYREYYS
ncbi:ATP-binding cassette domain-containing protein [Halovivax ruber]|nr:ABC transporter ATP-binding protein [Halovivax ruber]